MYLKVPCFLPQVHLLDPLTRSERITSLLIKENETLCGVSQEEISEDVAIEESSTWVVGPGLVDLYSHSGEPGYEARETLSSLQKAAEQGGFAEVMLLPNTQPAIDNLATLDFFRNSPFRLWGAITKGCAGEQLTQFMELADHVVGFSDGQPMGNLLLVRRAMEYAYPLGKPLLLMAQDTQLAETGVMRECIDSLRLGLTGIPVSAETIALFALIELVRLTRASVHFMRISCAASLPLLERAKQEGLPITASVAWYHLVWEVSQVYDYNPYWRVNPPLAPARDRHALIKAIKTGVIDAIAVDHSPYTYEEKMVPFEVAPTGMIGLQFVLPVLWQQLVEPGHLTALELWQALSTNPAHCLGITPPHRQTFFDPNKVWHVNYETSSSRSQNTPLWDQSIQGKSWIHYSLL